MWKIETFFLKIEIAMWQFVICQSAQQAPHNQDPNSRTTNGVIIDLF